MGEGGFGRGDWIRTNDIYVPNVALCQTELHPEARVMIVQLDAGFKQ